MAKPVRRAMLAPSSGTRWSACPPKQPSRVIPLYRGTHYTADIIPTGLVVQNRRTGKGTHLTYPAATEWIEAIRTAIDSDEAHALCRAIANP